MIIFGVGLSVLVVMLIGLIASRKVEGDSARYLVAGRTLGIPLVAAGLMGQAVDSNATLGNTDLTFGGGFWAGATLPLGLALCLLLTGAFFAKPMHRAKLTTLPDFYRRRFGRGVEVTSSYLMIGAYVILLAGNLVAGGFLFERFLGTSFTAGVLLIVGIVLTYTITGGMFADAYTAVVQLAITLTGTAALFLWVAVRYGISIPDGMGPFDWAQLTSADSGATINWATLVALGIGDIVAIDFMQRIFSARSPEIAQRACYLGAAGTVLVGVPFSLVALSSIDILGASAGDGPALFTLLDDVAPTGLAVLVLSAIVAASCNTANGAILGTGAVAARNIAGIRATEPLTPGGPDPLLRATRLATLPVVALAVLLALRVPQTGILLTLAFDVMLAGLVVPFVLGLFWRRGTAAAATAAIVVGSAVRLTLFVLTPTIYGADNNLLHVSNDVFTAEFDGWPTFLAAAASLLAYLVVALLRRPGPLAAPAPEERGTRPEPAAL
ncbi:sodium:solute symporter family protein [Streptomyces sp. NBC_01803]|uniref:sodium:solute symporter family protein n=1 Tax=Streptomyces sp. NBC_01803 TaxID=2975946 RepID=UPI002DDAC72F|nr:sodium:solute symporter family protein [Streptomyces sp. NBC_01803]WSA42906.1 sodium:solute symporter family protein [Streptomyces sp. NBC_01803]